MTILSGNNAKAFTMIELSIVLLIISLASAAVTVRVEGPRRLADIDEATQQFAKGDRIVGWFLS